MDAAAEAAGVRRDRWLVQQAGGVALPDLERTLNCGVGMVALTGQWWLEVRKPKKDEVAAHLVNLAWKGLSAMEHKPKLRHR